MRNSLIHRKRDSPLSPLVAFEFRGFRNDFFRAIFLKSLLYISMSAFVLFIFLCYFTSGRFFFANFRIIETFCPLDAFAPNSLQENISCNNSDCISCHKNIYISNALSIHSEHLPNFIVQQNIAITCEIANNQSPSILPLFACNSDCTTKLNSKTCNTLINATI